MARHEVITLDQLIHVLDGKISDPNELDTRAASLRRTLRILDESDRMIHRNSFKPDNYSGRGTLPIACWLSENGAEWARDKFPRTDPKSHRPGRSTKTIPHDIARTDTRISIFDMCASLSWEIGWRKTDLFHLVKPDDFFEITNQKTAHFFLEEEKAKKSLQELYDKCKPFVDLYGKAEFKKLWRFRYYNVIIPMRDEDARQSVLVHFAGGCNCIDPHNRKLHKDAPFKLASDILWFTTHELITTNPSGDIFLTPKDHEQRSHSFINISTSVSQAS